MDTIFIALIFFQIFKNIFGFGYKCANKKGNLTLIKQVLDPL